MRWVKRQSLVLSMLAAVTGCVAAQTESEGSRAEDASDAVLLVAHPRLAHPVYRQSVIIAIPIEGDQHLGLIINRPSTRSLASAFPDHGPSKRVEAPVYFGGPAQNRALAAAVKTPADPGEGSLKLLNGLWMVMRAALVDRIIETTPNEARYYLGHVRWRPGELRQELDRRLWYVASPEVSMLFHRDPNALWTELMERVRSMRADALEATTPTRAMR